MRDPMQDKRGDNPDVDLTAQAAALLELLALGEEDVAAGRVKPAAEVVARLRARKKQVMRP